MKHIVIVGGGFGGVYAAKTLLKKMPEAHVTLINKTNYFLFIPMLHEIATGSLCGHTLAEPIRDILKGKHFQFFKDIVQQIDLEKHIVKLSNQEISYDYLVLASGSKTNFHGTPGDEHCLTLKNLGDARAIKNCIIESAELAIKEKNKKKQQALASLAIIGAGPTGIELAIESKELFDQLLAHTEITPKVYLIQRGDSILPQHPSLKKTILHALEKHHITLLTNSKVSEILEHEVKITGQSGVIAQTIIWTAGIKPNIIPTKPSLLNDQGRITVNEYLQVPAHPTVFVIGDVSTHFPQGSKTPTPALAQIATQEGKHAAKNIIRLIGNSQLEPFHPKIQGFLLSLGRKKGVGIIFGITIHGFFAWWLMRTIYLFKIPGFGNKLKVAYDWTLNLFLKRDTSQQ